MLDIPKGTNIYRAAEMAVAEARRFRMEVQFEFNEIYLSVSPLSCADDIAVIYSLKSEIRRLKA